MNVNPNQDPSKALCGVAVSLRAGKLARHLGVSIEVPVEDIQAMVYTELGSEQSQGTVIMVDRTFGEGGSYQHRSSQSEDKWPLGATHEQVVRLCISKHILKGYPKNVSHTIRHELTHARDSAAMGHEKTQRRYKMHQLIAGVTATEAVLGLQVILNPEILSPSSAEALSLGTAIVASVMSGVGLAYLTNPSEIRAFRHERQMRQQTEPLMIYSAKAPQHDA